MNSHASIHVVIIALLIPSFIAGVLMFFAPCTLPLVPGFLAFISGVSPRDLKDSHISYRSRRIIFLNGVWYVLGFSLVFILLGVLFGLGGATLIHYREWLARLGGVFVIGFGLYLAGFSNLSFFRFLNKERRLHPGKLLKPGQPSSSFLFGATFAFGWSPCIGPILGSILLLAWSAATVWQGALLLIVFSSGLAIPFLLLAASIGTAVDKIKKVGKYLPVISKIGGIFLIFLGILLVFNKLDVWTATAFNWFSFLQYDKLLNYL